MDFGWHLPCYGPLATRENLIRVAREAEAGGLESVFVSDHVALPFAATSGYEGSRSGAFPIPPTATFLEPLTALAVVAAVTERVSLGTTVLVLPHRHPVLAAKTIATLDSLSGGRVIVGVGVGWLREEIEMLGVPYERRGAWSDEALGVMKRCWADERSKHAGEFFRFSDVGCYPKPVQEPYPPLWIGGRSPAAYRRVARFGDGFHAAWSPPDLMCDQIREVFTACGEVGRLGTDLTFSVRAGFAVRDQPSPRPTASLVGPAAFVIEQIVHYAGVGVGHIVLEAPLRSLEDHLSLMHRFIEDIRPFTEGT
jgi:probable F420-dependent oxidoreductase